MDLLPKMKRRQVVPKYLIELKGILDLKFIKYESEESRAIDDIRGSAEYRRERVKALTKRAIKQSFGTV
jgi:CO/xanthine dehydrogenase FAD-binding subunit